MGLSVHLRLQRDDSSTDSMAILETLLLLEVALPGGHTTLEALEILGDWFPRSLRILGAKIPGIIKDLGPL
jgi:hypothetical protein